MQECSICPNPPWGHTTPLPHTSKTNTFDFYSMRIALKCIILICKVCAYLCKYEKNAHGVDGRLSCIYKYLFV